MVDMATTAPHKSGPIGFAVFAAGEVTYVRNEQGQNPDHVVRGLAEALADTIGGQVVPAY